MRVSLSPVARASLIILFGPYFLVLSAVTSPYFLRHVSHTRCLISDAAYPHSTRFSNTFSIVSVPHTYPFRFCDSPCSRPTPYPPHPVPPHGSDSQQQQYPWPAGAHSYGAHGYPYSYPPEPTWEGGGGGSYRGKPGYRGSNGGQSPVRAHMFRDAAPERYHRPSNDAYMSERQPEGGSEYYERDQRRWRDPEAWDMYMVRSRSIGHAGDISAPSLAPGLSRWAGPAPHPIRRSVSMETSRPRAPSHHYDGYDQPLVPPPPPLQSHAVDRGARPSPRIAAEYGADLRPAYTMALHAPNPSGQSGGGGRLREWSASNSTSMSASVSSDWERDVLTSLQPGVNTATSASSNSNSNTNTNSHSGMGPRDDRVGYLRRRESSEGPRGIPIPMPGSPGMHSTSLTGPWGSAPPVGWRSDESAALPHSAEHILADDRDRANAHRRH